MIHHYFDSFNAIPCVVAFGPLAGGQTVLNFPPSHLEGPNGGHLLSHLFLDLVAPPHGSRQVLGERQTLEDHFGAELFGHEPVDGLPESGTFLIVQDHNFIALMIIMVCNNRMATQLINCEKKVSY